MLFNFDPIYLIWILVAASAALTAEAVYLLGFSTSSYRSQINRRLMLSKDRADREAVLVAWRRERGLTESGGYFFNFAWLNRLIVQSGVTLGLSRLALLVGIASVIAFAVTLVLRNSVPQALLAAVVGATVLPYFALRFLRGRRQKKFTQQFPDALDTIVRSLRAGHPVPTAIATVGRDMPDPVGSEFGIVADEITYGADLETALRDLHQRLGTNDLPLFVTAVAIQNSTGGNLGEVLDNLSGVIRERFKMRRKVRALASEGRAAALILSALPVGLFFVIQFTSPEFYASVWHENLTKMMLGGAVFWMLVGNAIMFKMVNFKI